MDKLEKQIKSNESWFATGSPPGSENFGDNSVIWTETDTYLTANPKGPTPYGVWDPWGFDKEDILLMMIELPAHWSGVSGG
ncbi:MAG: hypothetical protein ACN4GW_03350 [Desulforhopalus sp.]